MKVPLKDSEVCARFLEGEPGGNLLGFEVGQRIADYEIVGLLGVGGMGRVYRVRNVISHRTEAMKVLLADLQAEPDLAARFVTEIRTLAGLDHPNIAQLHTALQAGNELVMMMEFVDGLTLQQLAEQAVLPSADVVNYMHQVLSALSFAHNHGVVHRDIKPANIMVTPQGIVKLTDFGIAKSKVERDLTCPGATVGSLNYMSPEQAQGGCPVDGRSDLYSVGVTMYELLAGYRPFDDESAYVILHSQLNVVPRPPIEINPLLRRPLSDLIMKALEKDPAKRFQSAAEFSDALSDVTGIRPSKPIERPVPAALATGALPAKRAFRHPSVTVGNSRFLMSTRRRWIAGEAVAVLAVVALSVSGIPHFVKAGVIATEVRPPAAPSPRFPVVEQGSVAANRVLLAPTLADPIVRPLDSEIIPPSSSAGPVPPHATAGPSGRPGKIERAKMSPVVYAPPAPAEIEPNDAPVAARVMNASASSEMQQVHSQRTALDARAAAVRINVQRLKSERESAGGGLDEDIAAAYVRMNAYLGAERADLEDGDISAARDHIEKAAYEVSVLEKMFNHKDQNK
jgi:eukaryotic-like serine/threonine-protein kinase